MTDKAASANFYAAYRFGECMGAAYGTKEGVERWATGKWGAFVHVYPCTEEEASSINKH